MPQTSHKHHEQMEDFEREVRSTQNRLGFSHGIIGHFGGARGYIYSVEFLEFQLVNPNPLPWAFNPIIHMISPLN